MNKIGTAVLITCAVWLVLTRWHTYAEPLDRDISTYAVIAHEMRAGRSLYSDLWDIKPPAPILTFALAEAISGYGAREVFVINLLCAFLILVGLYRAGRVIGGSSQAGAWAAALWTVVSGDLWFQGNQPNTEAPINVCLVWIFFLLARSIERSLRDRDAILIGLLIGWASLYKQAVVVPGILMALVTMIPFYGEGRLKERMRAGLIIGAAAASLWAITCAYFYARGHFGDFYDAVFRFNLHYVNAGPESLTARSAHLWRYYDALLVAIYNAKFARILGPLTVVGLAGVAYGWWTGQRPWSLLIAAYGVGAFIAVALPGHFYPHYYQLLIPPLTLAAGWALSAYGEKKDELTIRHWAGVLLLVPFLAFELPYYRWSSEQWSQAKYEDRFTSLRPAVQEINALLQPQENFYNWGSEAGLYFLTHRRPPSGVLQNYPLVKGPLIDSLSVRVLRDLEREKPLLLIVSKYRVPQDLRPLPLIPWLMAHYAPLRGGADRGAFLFYGWRGGRLALEDS